MQTHTLKISPCCSFFINGDTLYGVILWVFELNVRALKQSAGNFTAEPLCLLRRTEERQKRAKRNSCLRLRPRSVFGSFDFALTSCKLNFSRSTISWQNSVCLQMMMFDRNLLKRDQSDYPLWFWLKHPSPLSLSRDFKIGHYGRLGRLDAYTGGMGPWR